MFPVHMHHNYYYLFQQKLYQLDKKYNCFDPPTESTAPQDKKYML